MGFSWQKILEWVAMLSFKGSFEPRGPTWVSCISCIAGSWFFFFFFFLPLSHWGSPFLNSVSAKSLQSCPTLCDPVDSSPPSSSAHGILQVRILKWVAMPSFRGSFRPRDWTHLSYVSCTKSGFFTTQPLGRPFFWADWEAKEEIYLIGHRINQSNLFDWLQKFIWLVKQFSYSGKPKWLFMMNCS